MLGANDRIKGLIIKHLKEELTVEEQLELQSWVALSGENREIFDQLTDPDILNAALVELHEARINIFNKVNAKITSSDLLSPTIVRPLWRRIRIYVAAASLLIVFATSYFWLASLFTNPSKARPVSATVAVQDVAPGGNKAILTLGNGSTIILQNAADGKLSEQGASHVSKRKDQLAYKTLAGASSAVVYNTLTTPRAGQFQVILPDGTKVFLNNASSLRYPTSFTGSSREVELTGEAYFDVAKNSLQPFSVLAGGETVHVLGTSFNIMAYGDEPAIKTTLVTGKVSVNSAGKQSVLSPGEQAILPHNGTMTIAKEADIEGATAWQRGFFHFTHANISDVLRQLARWYDVEVQFTIPVPEDYTFDGEIGRSLNLLSILKHLEKKDLHFTIENKKLIVSR
jgi:transmembrane sensor